MSRKKLTRRTNPPPTYRNVETYLAGVMHEARSVAILRLSLRDLVLLRREPDNPSDANAILVETKDGQVLGHIRRELASYLSPSMSREAQPIEAMVTDLSCDATGSAYRVRINFSVPQEWFDRKDAAQAPRDQAIEYTYEDNGPNLYLLLNCSDEQFIQIRARMAAEHITHSRFGLCFRAAHNGRLYQWYVHIDKTPQMNRHLIEEFFRKNFNVVPDSEVVRALEEDNKRAQAEMLKLGKEAQDYGNWAEEIDAESKVLKKGLEEKISHLEFEIEEREEKIAQIQGENRRLVSDNMPDDLLAGILDEVISESLTPRQSLLVIKRLFPGRIVVLESALKSADQSRAFRARRKLFKLLWDLADGYWRALASNKGDAEARLVFGDHYAAQESERVQSGRNARKIRTFTYKGKQLLMMKHLKITGKRGPSETIRVHFEWLPTEHLIVIGHCGPHLDDK